MLVAPANIAFDSSDMKTLIIAGSVCTAPMPVRQFVFLQYEGVELLWFLWSQRLTLWICSGRMVICVISSCPFDLKAEGWTINAGDGPTELEVIVVKFVVSKLAGNYDGFALRTLSTHRVDDFRWPVKKTLHALTDDRSPVCTGQAEDLPPPMQQREGRGFSITFAYYKRLSMSMSMPDTHN